MSAAACFNCTNESQKGGAVARPNFGCKVAVSCTASSSTCQTRKRKIGGVDTVDKENVPFPARNDMPAVKRICREKTGTEWQTVLDVIAYNEEQRKGRDKYMAVTQIAQKQ